MRARRAMSLLMVTIFVLFLCTGCRQNRADLTSAFIDLSYGEDEAQRVDLYLPKGRTGETGLVLFIHGGAWVAGDKSVYTDQAVDVCLSHGVAAATVNYRLLSENVAMADILQDIGAALARIRDAAAAEGIVLSGVLLTGASAGGHLALLYAYSCGGTTPIPPAAVVSYCGPSDLTDPNFYNGTLGDMPAETMKLLMSYALGREASFETVPEGPLAEALREISPVNYVSGNTVPTVIAHGRKDTVVPYSNAEILDAALTAAGATHVLVSYPNSGHGLGEDRDAARMTRELLKQYIQDYLAN